MTTRDSVRSAQAAQTAMLEAQSAMADATSKRDTAVAEARQSGASAIEIADAIELSRQQIHKILDKHFPSTVQDLRAEVIVGNVKYEDLLEDDRMHVDLAVRQVVCARRLVSFAQVTAIPGVMFAR